MEFMLVIRDGEWKPCAYFIDGKRVSKEAYNIMEYEIQTHGVADCFLTRRSRNGNFLYTFAPSILFPGIGGASLLQAIGREASGNF